MLKKLGYAVAKRPKLTIFSWFAALALIVLLSLTGAFTPTLFEKLSSAQPSVPSESASADKLLEGESGGSAFVVLLRGDPVEDSKLAEYGELVNQKLGNALKEDVPGVELASAAGLPKSVIEQQPALEALTAPQGQLLLVTGEEFSKEQLEELTATVEDFGDEFKEYGIALESGHPDLIADQLTHQASEDLKKGELISLPLALLVMVLVFGGFLAAAMPLLGAGASIAGGLGALYLFAHFMDIDVTVLNVVTVIGLGVSIDYGLLFISRYREVVREHPETTKEAIAESVATTVDTAGRTVIFSGLTIALAISSLLVFEASIMKSVAVSASAVILISVLVTITLLPAIVALLGKKLIQPSPLTKTKLTGAFLKRFGDVAPTEGFFSKVVDLIAKAPKTIMALSLILLLGLGSGLLSLHVSNSGTPYLAKDKGQIGFFNELARDFPAFASRDIQVVTEDESVASALKEQLVSREGVSSVELSETGKLWTVSADSEEAESLVTELRERANSKDFLVTGTAAKDVDFNQSLLDSLPLALFIVGVATFILLFLLTGSVFIPLKAIILSALSLGASVGVLTWGFEGGGLAGLLAFDAHEITGLSPIILVLAATFGFGLAMDYEVFLIARIKEERDKGLSAREAVRAGLQGSGRIITSAGFIIIVVFLGFTLGDMLMIKQIGVALAVAVLIDMTLVRTVIVPAIMLSLGEKAWWAPRPLKRVYEKFGLKH